VSVDRTHALAECAAWFSIDGVTPPNWDKISGLYPCGDAFNYPQLLPRVASRGRYLSDV